MTKPRTAFERDLKRDLKDPAFRAEYERTRARIEAIDRVLNQLDERRRELGLSKAELARRAHANEVVIRRLFSAPDQNPTFATLVDVARALGLEFRPTQQTVRRPTSKRIAAAAKRAPKRSQVRATG
ncbi:MAG: helix-turn-helix domain-containing protein [Actinomycetota bacterium]